MPRKEAIKTCLIYYRAYKFLCERLRQVNGDKQAQGRTMSALNKMRHKFVKYSLLQKQIKADTVNAQFNY